MSKYKDVKVGEKLPGTYCPLCGEMGLRKMVFEGVVWAVCPMVDDEPVVEKLEDAHTAWVLETKAGSPKPKVKQKITPASKPAPAPRDEVDHKGVEDA